MIAQSTEASTEMDKVPEVEIPTEVIIILCTLLTVGSVSVLQKEQQKEQKEESRYVLSRPKSSIHLRLE
jgi:hypothetical protein